MTVLRNDGEIVVYQRGTSRISVRSVDVYRAFDRFKGRRVSSSDLRCRMRTVFDPSARPAGHSCNRTFFFQVLQRLSLTTGPLEGRGVRGDPFAVRFVQRNLRSSGET